MSYFSFASKPVCLLVILKHPEKWILVCLCLSLEISRGIRDQKSTEYPKELQAFPGKAISHGQGSVPCSCHRNIIIIIGILTSPAPGAAAGIELLPYSLPALTDLWWWPLEMVLRPAMWDWQGRCTCVPITYLIAFEERTACRGKSRHRWRTVFLASQLGVPSVYPRSMEKQPGSLPSPHKDKTNRRY